MTRTNNFESNLVQSLKNYFNTHSIPADVRRFPMLRWTSQPCDLIFDSPVAGHYGFECKSTSSNKLWFTAHFHVRQDGTHQVNALDDYFIQSGRTAFLAVELKKKGNVNRCCFVPWWRVIYAYQSGKKSLKESEMTSDCVCLRHGKYYHLDDFFSCFV
jgi:hypothetical protein